MSEVDPVALARDLIRCESVTPNEGGALALLDDFLSSHGFATHRLTFSDEATPDVENLFAKFGSGTRHFVYAGHTDVVPVGDENAWSHDPFEARIENEMLIGRGAADMKGSIAAFAAAASDYLNEAGDNFNGAISFLITGDEEGPAINGTDKLLKWAASEGESFSHCLVGEPTNPDSLGDMIKIGRRGSLNGQITVTGTQGHVAYPHLANNPIPTLNRCIDALLRDPLDEGNENFQATNLEITSIDVGNTASNVIPAKAVTRFNIRFNNQWSPTTLIEWIKARLSEAGDEAQIDFEIIGRPSESFMTDVGPVVEPLEEAIEAVTGRKPSRSTTGGTSDARFIKDYCPVLEFGLVGKTMHMVDEQVPVGDIVALKAIYLEFLKRYFATS